MLIGNNVTAFPTARGFVVLEGVNGAGKGTLLRLISEYLSKKQISFISSFEPGATALGKNIRKLVLENSGEKPNPEAEMLLFSADRREHVAKVIEPALKSKKLVILDRFYYSGSAFQGYGRQLNLDLINQINKIAIAGTVPDLVILLDLDPAEGLKRSKKREAQDNIKAGKDVFEKEELAFHQRLRQGYLEIARSSKEPFIVIDASKTPSEIFEEVRPLIDALLKSLNETNK